MTTSDEDLFLVNSSRQFSQQHFIFDDASGLVLRASQIAVAVWMSKCVAKHCHAAAVREFNRLV